MLFNNTRFITSGICLTFALVFCPLLSYGQFKTDHVSKDGSALNSFSPVVFQASDNAPESNFGVNLVGAEFVWFTEFETQASDFPLNINTLDMFTFNRDCEDEIVDLYLYADPDSDPTTGAVPLCEAQNVPSRFGLYSVADARSIETGGPCCVQSTPSIIVAAVNRTCQDNTRPAAIDQTLSQGTSWFRISPNLNEADPPTLVATGAIQKVDDIGLSGNWMLRAQGVSNDAACNLPVELSEFHAEQNGSEVLLKWTTLSELNNSGFEIEMSSGEEFRTIGFVEGFGTTSIEQNYEFILSDINPGHYTFRLRQVDFDGAFEYSPLESVFISLPGGYLISKAYPNPFNPTSIIQVGLRESEEVQIELYNSLGHLVRTIYQGSIRAETMTSFTIEAEGLPTGQYIVSVRGEDWMDQQLITFIK